MSAVFDGLHKPAHGLASRGRGGAVMPPAVVIGLDSITGLQAARILAGHRIPVIGVTSDPSHPCCRTNVCASIVTTDPGRLGLIRTLERLGPHLVHGDEPPEAAVLFPCSDASVLLLSRHRSRLLPWFRVALPDEDVVELLLDKERFYRYAQREGLPIPDTRFLLHREDAVEAGRALQFPCIVKPAVKTSEWRSLTQAKAIVAVSAAELLEVYDLFATYGQCLIAQALVEGPDTEHYTCNCYFDEASRPLVTFVSRKLRQWPREGGEGCLSEEIRNDAVRDMTVMLFGKVGFHGLGYLETKRDHRTDEYFIIEPNAGRPTGRSSNAEAAGVELLYTQYCDLLRLPLPTSRQQQYRGVKWVHTRRDLQSALHRIRTDELTMRGWLESWRGPIFHALFSWRDPVPFFADVMRVGTRLLSRRRQSRGVSARRHRVSEEAAHAALRRPTGSRIGRPRRRHEAGPRDARVRILTYHRVIDPAHPSVGHPGIVSATPASFDRQMGRLERHYNVVSAARVLDALEGWASLPPRSVLITFDDAYADFAEWAWPILRRRGLPATMFVPTAYPDDPSREFWWDRLHRVFSSTRRTELVGTPLGRLDLRPEVRCSSLRVVREWIKALPHVDALRWIEAVCQELGVSETRPSPVLGWEALRRLAADGVTLAPHTQTHARLDRLPLDAAAAEIRGSQDDLEREVGSSRRMFAYPFGFWNEGVVELLRKEGYQAALTQQHGHNILSTADPLRLRRTNVSQRTSPIALALRLTSTGARWDRWRQTYRRIRRSSRRTDRRVGGGRRPVRLTAFAYSA